MPRLLRFLLVVFLLATTLVIPATDHASSTPRSLRQTDDGYTRITFEELDAEPFDGTDHAKMDTYYDYKLGVRFDQPLHIDYVNGLGDGGDSTFPRSGDNAVQHCYGEENGNCSRPLVITFDEPQSHVRVWVGVFRDFETTANVQMTAFGEKDGGPVIASTPLELTPIEGGRLPVNQSVEVKDAANRNSIMRVEVGFSPAADASWLVFDDVEFKAVGVNETADPPECSEETQDPPVLQASISEEAQNPHVNAVPLTGSIASTFPIWSAILTSSGPKGEKSMALDPEPFNQENGAFVVTVEDILLPGSNDLTLTVASCGGSDQQVLHTTYTPIEGTPSYELLGVEVTQAIQDLENNVPLIAGKRTFVRVYLRVTEGAPLQKVSGTLPVCHAPVDDPTRCSTPGSVFTPLSSDAGNLVDAVDYVTDKREYMAESLDFEVKPEMWEPGALWLDLSNLTLSPELDCVGCDTPATGGGLMSVDFQEAPILYLQIADSTYMLNGKRSRPRDLDWKRLESWLERAYPTSDVQLQPGRGDVPSNSLPFPCAEINQQMFDLWVNTLNLQTEEALEATPLRFLALVPHPRPDINPDPPESALDDTTEDTLKKYAGCAAMGDNRITMPDGTPAIAVRFATSVSGTGKAYDWDDDGSFADFYGAHELGHVFGLEHVGSCGNTDGAATSPDGKISEGEQYFGFDMGDSSLDSDPPPPGEIARTPYHPEFTYDVMSYCKDRWISAKDYTVILANLPTTPLTPVPEPAPDPDPEPTRTPEPEPTSTPTSEPRPDNVVGMVSSLAFSYGLDAAALSSDGLLAPAAQGGGGGGDGDGGGDVDGDEDGDAVDEVVTVIGTILLPEDGPITATILPFSRRPGVAVTPLNTNGEYRIVLEDKDGRELVSYPFQPSPYSEPTAEGIKAAQMSEVVRWDEDTDVIKIYGPDPAAGTSNALGTPTPPLGPIATQEVSEHFPEVTILSPNGGETLTATTTVTWKGDDADTNDTLTYTLLYSTDSGATWIAIAGGLKEQRYTVDLDRLLGSDTAIFRVIATDGVNTGQDDSDKTFTAPNNAPDVGIITPATGSHFGSSHDIVLVGRATDIEQGELDGSSLEWSSSIDGPIGPGRATSVKDLTPGVHTITLTATDAEGISTESTIQVAIGDDDPPVETWDPSKDISSVPDGLFFYGGNERRGEAYTTDGAGAIQPLNTYFTFLHEWSAIVPGHFSGEDALTDLFLYSTETGLGEFYTSDGEGGLTLLSSSKDIPKPATGWEMVIPGDFGGDDTWTDLFFYDRETNRGTFYTSDGDGQLRFLDTTPVFDETWTSIVPGNFGGNDRTDLLFYNKDTGLSQFFTTDGRGCLWLLLEDPDWTPGWDQIVPGNFDGNGDWTDLFFSRVVDGKGGSSREYKVYATDGQGTIVELGQPGQIAPNWTTMIGGDFSGDDTMTDLLFYDAVTGQRVFLATDGAGGLIELSQPATGSAGWDLIVPGRYTGAG